MLKQIGKFSVMAGLLGLVFSGVLQADEFSEVNDILNRGDASGKQALGTTFTWFFALFLPVICIFSGAIMGYQFQKKKAEQEQNTTKLYVVTGAAAIIGFFLFIGVTMIISSALVGDKSGLFKVITNFWRATLGI